MPDPAEPTPPAGGNADGGTNPPESPRPTIDLAIALRHWRLLLGLLAAIVVSLIAVAFLLDFPNIGRQPTSGEPPDIERANALVGAYLVRWGLVVVLVAFVAELFFGIASSFRVPDPEGGAEVGAEGAGLPAAVFKALFDAIPGLLKVPAGIGIALILIGVVLLLGTTLGVDEGEPNGSPRETPSGEAAPTPSSAAGD